jgi:hypothetical protein
VNAKIPKIDPTILLAFFDLKKEPWPQSWKMIKIRTRKPAARIHKGIIYQIDIFRTWTITIQSKIYGTNELMICQILRESFGWLYLVMISCHEGVSGGVDMLSIGCKVIILFHKICPPNALLSY